MRTLKDIPQLENIPVLVRAALNVPVANGKVVNTFRLRSALPTIEYLRKHHAKVILMSHISGRGTETLEPMWQAMKEFIPGVAFCKVTVGEEARAAVRNLNAGGVLILENLRRNAGEEKNDPEFARALAELADVFVEDSFDVCHRAHASVVGIASLLPSYAGLLVEAEVKELSGALTPVSPSLAVIGGAKFSTKQPVLARLLELYDHVFVGGALANDFLKEKGYPVGASLTSDAKSEDIRALLSNPRLVIPVDAIVAPKGSMRSDARAAELHDIRQDEAILDVGPKTTEALCELASRAKTTLWNGPLGFYENGFLDSTTALAESIAGSSSHSIIGGGDTIAAIENLKLSGKFSFLSTGGGAMLDFLAEGTLVGIEVLY